MTQGTELQSVICCYGFGPTIGVATNKINSGISFMEIMKLYIISASNMAILEFVEQEMGCVL
jgi:hypothetical protein